MKSKREKLEALLKIAQREGIVPSDALIEVGKYNTRDLIKELATIPELWDAEKLSGIIPADQYPLFTPTERGAVPPTEGRVGIILTEHGWDRRPSSQFIQTMGGGRGGTGPAGAPGANGADGINGTNGTDGADGIGIEWLGTFPNAPLAPTLNQAYRNSTDGIAYIWNGLVWSEMVHDGIDGTVGTGTNSISSGTSTNLDGIFVGDGNDVGIISNGVGLLVNDGSGNYSWESEMITDTKYSTNHLDDYTTANVTYAGQEDKDGVWKIVRIDETGTFPVITYASITNNPTLTTYALAWAARVTATYAIYETAF